MCSSKTQRTITLRSTEAKYVALLSCAQEVKFFNMLLEELPEVKKPSVVYGDLGVPFTRGFIFINNFAHFID